MDTKPEGLVGPPAELRFTLTVTRKDTGKVETYEMVGRIEPPQQEQENGNNP